MKIFPGILFLCILIYSCVPDENTSGNKKGESIYGIDISNHQGKIYWSIVKTWKGNEISFVYMKATEGKTHVDKSYRNFVKGAKEHGFLIGSYHYFRTTSSPKEQFNNFIRNVDKEKQDLLPLIDVEEMQNWNSRLFHKNFKEFLILVEKHFDKKPMIYTVNSFYNKHLTGKYSGYKFMIGRYGDNKPNMRDKHDWTIWQFTENGNIKGIPKKVDIDLLNPEFELSDLLLKTTQEE